MSGRAALTPMVPRGAPPSGPMPDGAGRPLTRRRAGPGRPNPAAVLKIVERVIREGDVRSGQVGTDLGPEDARALLRSWLESMDLRFDEQRLLELLQDGELAHPDLFRRARRIHERKLAGAVNQLVSEAASGAIDFGAAQRTVFDPCLPAIPYAAATAFLGREKHKLTRSDGDRPRAALVADGLGGMHGVTHTIQQIRERGVPGYEVEVIGTDADVDRRLSAVAEGRYDLVHLCSPGPAGLGAWLLARVLELPVIGSYHSELAAYAGLRSGQAQIEALATIALGGFYSACDVVLSPSPASDARLSALGVDGQRVARWDRGVDLERFDPQLRRSEAFPGVLSVLYVGRLTKEKGVDLLAQRLRKSALATVSERTWERSLERLADGYRSALLRTSESGRARDVA